ncbi:geranylgeranylglycerol-phosphate geranylgeranyltransferase [Alkalitalea saponilacus]|uniref:4-hydroxybenzoate polyprenyltransferase n=1 Tax=Alkalitalea saponilacus TaxID=889453 RepID=A0A1T5HTQ7_9BACT|nr:geranylgeranylglycerol-phosphate geranylgeranyltransferase [Alkalitalea saponilacus]SKC23931.1 4-hydroxybenzoate polyprenyltransferase [Alkalitalea saponilacus]
MMAFLRLIRFKNLVIIVLLQYLLRYGLLLPMLEFYDIVPALSDLRFLLLVIATVFLAASGYVINDYFDLRIDRVNRPDKVVVGYVFQRRTVLLFHVIFTFIGVFTGLFLAYITRKETYALMFILLPFLLWYYSTTLKKQMILGNLIISLLTALVAYFVVSLEFAALARIHGDAILETEACSMAWFWTTGFAFFAFISNLGREIIKDMEDVKGDKIAGCHTLPIEMGMGYTKTIVVILSLASVIFLWVIYAVVPELNQSDITLAYFVLLLTLPYLLIAARIYSAQETKHYHQASQLSKLTMLFGILFILVARTFFV